MNTSATMDIERLARPEILAMSPYKSARNTAAADGILLNANEAPRSLLHGTEWSGLSLNRYPVPQPSDLTGRLAGLYDVDTGRVLVTRGSDEGIDLLIRVFCRAGKDAIIECPPCFGMYRVGANIQGAGVIAVPRDAKHDLKVDIDKLCLEIAANKQARLVFLTSPNNPTGEVITLPELERVLKACARNALLVLDEAYIEFCTNPSAVELLDRWPNLVVLRTLSKAWGAAGLRCGTVLAHPAVIRLLQRVMAPYPLSAPAIEAALAVTGPEAMAAQQQLLSEIAAEKTVLLEALRSYGWVRKVWPGAANFVLLQLDDAPGLVALCAEKGIRIRDFSSQPMLEGCVRLTIGSSEEMVELKNALDQYGEQA